MLDTEKNNCEAFETDFRATIARAKANGVEYIWSGDLVRNRYLRECLTFAEENNLVKIIPKEMEQETGFIVEWL